MNFARTNQTHENCEYFWNMSIPKVKNFAYFFLLSVPLSTPSWAVDDKNCIQCSNKVLVKETIALVYISIDLKAFLNILESQSNGATLSV